MVKAKISKFIFRLSNSKKIELRRNIGDLLLHWDVGGVCTLQAEGKARAWVWLTLIPNDDPPPSRTWHRHCGCDFTTLASCVQHPEVGVEDFPVM